MHLLSLLCIIIRTERLVKKKQVKNLKNEYSRLKHKKSSCNFV